MLVIRSCLTRFPSVHEPVLATGGSGLQVLGAVSLLVHISAVLNVLGTVQLLKHIGADLHVLGFVSLIVHVGDGGLDIGVLDFFPLSPHAIIFNT